MQKIRFLIFLAFLSSCSSTRWNFDSITGASAQFSSRRLTYTDSYSYGNIEFEILNAANNFSCFINVFTQEIPPLKDNPNQAAITLKIEEEEYHGNCHRFAGGQKVRLSDEMGELIIKTLQEGKTVSIIMDGYKGTIEPENFPKYYKKLKGEGFFWEDFF